MDTKVNYTVIGLFVILLTAGMVFTFVWLSGFGHQQSFRTYLVYASGGVDGLNIDSPVQYNGVRVGTVNKIELDSLNLQFVKLYLKINSKIPITDGTVATLIPQGITGLVYIGLKSETPKASLLKVEPGQTYPIIPYQKPLLTQITEVLPDLTKNLGEIAEKFKKIFSDPNIESISGTFEHLENVSKMLDDESSNLRGSIKSLHTVMENGATASKHFESTMTSARQAANQLSKTTSTINSELMPNVQDLLQRMSNTTSNLQELSDELKTNPSVIIRGKQPPPPGPGE